METDENWFTKRYISRMAAIRRPTTDYQGDPFAVGMFSRLRKDLISPDPDSLSSFSKYDDVLYDLSLENEWECFDEYELDIEAYEDFNNFIQIHEHILEICHFRYKESCDSVPIMSLLKQASCAFGIFWMDKREWIKRTLKDYDYGYGTGSIRTREDAGRVYDDLLLSCGVYHGFENFYMFRLDMWKRDHSSEEYKTNPLPNAAVNDALSNHKHFFYEDQHHAIYIIEYDPDLFKKIRSLRSDLIPICKIK